MSEEDKGRKPAKRDHGPQGTHVFSRDEVHKLVEEAGSPEGAPSARAQLRGVSVEVKGREFPLSGARFVVGRASACDIILSDSSVSSEHARVTHDAGGWRVVNLLSTNGTFVNDKRVSSEELHHGDRVRFGRVEFVFQDPDQASDRAGAGSTPKSGKHWLPWAVVGVVVIVVALVILL
ncbi:MAG: FHA domain-containing protein [Wenzhouxiangella sp.]|nr:MAG: FHA domain-containing protein [Wenzhouxiangella sp.]